MSDFEVILRAVFEGICLQPIALFGAILLCFAIPFILTLKAFLVRLTKARKEGRSPLKTILLVLTLPVGLVFALTLSILGKFARFILNFFIIVLVTILLIPASFIYMIRLLPGAIRALMEKVGRYGEIILYYVESSPRRFIEKIDAAWGEDIAQVNVHSANKAHPKLYSDPLIEKILELVGLSGKSLLEQHLHNPFVRQERPVNIIHTMGTKGAWQNLSRLGRDPNTQENIRAMAATELEGQRFCEDAARIWITLGKQSTSTLYKMKAADHLINMGYADQAQEILKLVLSIEELDPRWKNQVDHLHRKLSLTPTDGGTTGRDAASQLLTARFLFKDSLIDEATDLLSNIALSSDEILRVRKQAVEALHFYGRKDALMKLLANHDLPPEVRYLIIQAISRMGDQLIAIREYITLVEDGSIPLSNRVDAAAALAQIDQSECTHDLLLYLAGHQDRDSQLRTKLAWALQQAGWHYEANQVLTELIVDPATDRDNRKIAQRNLARLNTPRNVRHK